VCDVSISWALLRIGNPVRETLPETDRFLRYHLDHEVYLLCKSMFAVHNADAFVASDKGRIVGFASLLRLTPSTAAVASFRVSGGRAGKEASRPLLGATVSRARETLHRHLTCMVPKSGLPDRGILSEGGFSPWMTRETFCGSTKAQGNLELSPVIGWSQSLDIVKALPKDQAFNICFRPVPVSIESLGFVVEHGILLADPGDNGSIASVVVSDAVEGTKDRVFFVPGYLQRNLGEQTRLYGEITFLNSSDPRGVLKAASDWLCKQGIAFAYVYAKPDIEVGRRIVESGFMYRGAQEIWLQELAGPLDSFILRDQA